jgi:hypothetical protein
MGFVLSGGCLCGEIRFEIREAPLSAVLCHCRGCQLAHAAPCAPLALFPPGGVSILKGKPHRHDMIADSGSATFREFCGNCGTHLFSGGVSFPEFRAVKIVALDDPSTISPVAHVWTKQRISWSSQQGGLPEFKHQPEVAELERLWKEAMSGGK